MTSVTETNSSTRAAAAAGSNLSDHNTHPTPTRQPHSNDIHYRTSRRASAEKTSAEAQPHREEKEEEAIVGSMVQKNKSLLEDSFILSADSLLPEPETTRPTQSSRPTSAWGTMNTSTYASTSSPPPNIDSSKVATARNDLLAIMKEEEEAAAQRKREAVEANRIAELEQEEELIRLALERSLTDMNTSFSALPPDANTVAHQIKELTPNKSDNAASSSFSSWDMDGLARKIQEDVETTEGFVDSPHGHRKFLIRPSLCGSAASQPSGETRTDVKHDDDDILQEARRHLSPEEVEQIERALGAEAGESDDNEEQHPPVSAVSSNKNENERDDAKKPLSNKILSEFGLDDASEHLSPEELEQIAQALRETTDDVGTKTDPNLSNSVSGQKPAAQPIAISQEDSEAIARALKQANEDEERKSMQLALQMLQEDDKERVLTLAARRGQGNVRVMTRIELDAEGSLSQKASLPRVPYHLEDEVEENVSAGFRMNTNVRQEWTRRDQHSVVGPNNEIRTKHDAVLQGKANAHRLGLDTDDTEGGTLIGNKAYNSFMKSVRRTTNKGVAAHGTGRAGADTDATKGGAMDPSVRLEITRAINNGLINKCNGVVKEGKEAIIYHAEGGSECDGSDVAVKVFKRIQEFKGRGDYVEGDPRYAKKPFKKAGQREQLALWTEKEYRNLVRASRAGVPTPTPLLFKENILFMSFLGSDGWPAPQLRELELRRGSKRWTTLYNQVMNAVKRYVRMLVIFPKSLISQFYL